uniref:zinc finger protein 54-like n=1 Tax=Arvicanthis niloticus TaxID=61156 RepID=UPI00402BBCD1
METWKMEREETVRSVDIWGCGCGLLPGGMGMPGLCSEGFVHGCDVGELYNNLVSVENYCILDFVHKHVKAESESCRCNVLGEMLHEPSNCACYKTSKTTENSNNYRCCNDKDASNASNPGRHINMNTREEPCKFEDCEKSLNLLSNLIQDQRLYTAKKKHKQEYDDIFGSPYSLLKQTIYIVEKPRQCGECGKCFRGASSLTVHKKIHTGKKNYKCNLCDKSFNQHIHLKIHQRLHTGEKPYRCMECGKSFTVKSTLTKHQRIHTGQKPYKCNTCEKSFTQCSSLKTHQRLHTGEKPYKCKECGKLFPQL